jgi:hypothetical protein
MPVSCIHTSFVYTKESLLRRRLFKHACVLCPNLPGLHQKNPCYVEDHSNMPTSCVHTTEYTEWYWPLSGVHSIMMEKLATLVRAGGARPPPFTVVTIMYKVAMFTPAVRADPLPYTLWSIHPWSTPENLYYVEDHSNMPASCVYTSLVFTKDSIWCRRPIKHVKHVCVEVFCYGIPRQLCALLRTPLSP